MYLYFLLAQLTFPHLDVPRYLEIKHHNLQNLIFCGTVGSLKAGLIVRSHHDQ